MVDILVLACIYLHFCCLNRCRFRHKQRELVSLPAARIRIGQRANHRRTMKVKLISAADVVDSSIQQQPDDNGHQHAYSHVLATGRVGSEVAPSEVTTAGSDVTGSSLNRTLSEDEVRGIKLAEIRVDTV